MWRAWIGFNFSHSLGVLLLTAVAVWAGSRIKTLPVGIVPALTLIGCVHLVLALLYWFRIPAIGLAIGTGSPPHGPVVELPRRQPNRRARLPAADWFFAYSETETCR